MYGSTSCCISHGPCQLERAIFDPPPHSSETPGPIFMQLEIYNYFPDTTPHAKFQGPMSTLVPWWSGQIASLTHESFCLYFSFLSHAHRSHFWTHPNAQYVIMRRSHQGSAFWGLERLNLKLTPFIPQKRKNWDFKLAVNGKL